jgi:hypothetical protein
MSTIERVARHRVRDTEHYWCEVDEFRVNNATHLLCHIRFNRFSAAIFKQFLREWELFRAWCPETLFCVAGPDAGEKWLRFVRRLGFVPTASTIVLQNGAERQLFINVRDCPR